MYLSPDVLQGCELVLMIIISLLLALISANATVKHAETHDKD